MISAQEAHELIQSTKISSEVFAISEVSIEEATGLFLAEDIFANRNQPPFDRSMMDGIAISHSSFSQKKFQRESIARAGFERLTLENKTHCIEVMTGAPIPVGCDCVIPYEEVVGSGESFSFLSKDYTPKLGQFIHCEGIDYLKGDKLLEKGASINSTIISLLSSIGRETVKILELKNIAVISTGDELIDGGNEVLDHQIYKSNPHAIRAEILSFFPRATVDLFHFNDDEKEVLEGLTSILSSYKIIVISGGVSKGKYDFIPESLKSLGVSEVFHHVRQRPGKPLWFGVGESEQVIFGLPGNPVSSLVNTRRHIIPLLEKFVDKRLKTSFEVKASSDWEIGSNFTHFIPVSLSICEGTIFAAPSIGNNSGDFSKLVFSSGFIEIPPNEGRIVENQIYQYFPWGSLEGRTRTHGHG